MSTEKNPYAALFHELALLVRMAARTASGGEVDHVQVGEAMGRWDDAERAAREQSPAHGIAFVGFDGDLRTAHRVAWELNRVARRLQSSTDELSVARATLSLKRLGDLAVQFGGVEEAAEAAQRPSDLPANIRSLAVPVCIPDLFVAIRESACRQDGMPAVAACDYLERNGHDTADVLALYAESRIILGPTREDEYVPAAEDDSLRPVLVEWTRRRHGDQLAGRVKDWCYEVSGREWVQHFVWRCDVHGDHMTKPADCRSASAARLALKRAVLSEFDRIARVRMSFCICPDCGKEYRVTETAGDCFHCLCGRIFLRAFRPSECPIR